MVPTQGRPGVLLDRDGTLIRDVNYLRCLEQMELLPRVPESIRLLRQRGLKIAVVTNQSGVARGFFSEEDLEKIHFELKRRLERGGAFVDGIYYCPHHPTEGSPPYRIACACRKPSAGLARQAAADLHLDLARSYVVGDQYSDMELAWRIGAKGLLIRKDGGGTLEGNPAFGIVENLWEAAHWISRDLELTGS